MRNAMSIDYNYRINMAIRKLFVLSSACTYTIERELDERFAKVYPEFDPVMHTHLNAKQSDLEKAKYARQRRQSQSASATRQQNKTQGLAHRKICDEAVNYNPENDTLRVQGLNLRAVRERRSNASNNRDNNDRHQSLVSTEQRCHDSNDRPCGEGIPGRRRHNTFVVAPGGEINRWLES